MFFILGNNAALLILSAIYDLPVLLGPIRVKELKMVDSKLVSNADATS